MLYIELGTRGREKRRIFGFSDCRISECQNIRMSEFIAKAINIREQRAKSKDAMNFYRRGAKTRRFISQRRKDAETLRSVNNDSLS